MGSKRETCLVFIIINGESILLFLTAVWDAFLKLLQGLTFDCCYFLSFDRAVVWGEQVKDFLRN